METYISGTKKHRLCTRRRFRRGVSVSVKSSGSSAAAGAAPYPAASTAWQMAACRAAASASSDAVTCREFVKRLTAADCTPGTPDAAFSTWAAHAAQLMPVIS